MDLTVPRLGPLGGRIRVPGDKSISHRAAILAALCDGPVRVSGFLPSLDCLATLACLERLGVRIERRSATELTVQGVGAAGFREPTDVLDAANSGTTMRLLTGLLGAQPFFTVITGDSSLRRRPMARVAEPLRKMGAEVRGRAGGTLAPLAIHGGGLRGIDYRLPVASAQVKSAILLAGLFARGTTTVREPAPTRDHTERMLAYLGAALVAAESKVEVRPSLPLVGRRLRVPGDLSSAAFPVAAALLVPGSDLAIAGVGLNPTRTAFLSALERMGARVRSAGVREVCGEPVGTLRAIAGPLNATEIGGAEVPNLIDEVPVLAALATQARGTTVIRDAAELRVKESDRLHALAVELGRMGARIDERPDGLVIFGPTRLRGTRVTSYGDHRIAMALYIAGLAARGRTTIAEAECVDISFPGFDRLMQAATRR
ncbi:MAG: 3-phosphoshikimate 1-carboxyvinyltransferase [Planctomycetes bacterium]|nr:3-phosphoshikimate 1-carboxyvinyltransferase [Planctomycetota bacterium]